MGNYREAKLFNSKLNQKEIPGSIVAKASKYLFRSQTKSRLFIRANIANLVVFATLNRRNRFRFTKKVKKIDGMSVFEYTPNNISGITQTIIYAHGGGLFLSMQSSQLNVLADMAYQAKHQLVVPIYPLVQHSGGTAKHVHHLMNKTFDIYESQGKTISLVGDSAGGNIIMALATYRDNNGMTVPENVVALFPWLNLKLDNPASKAIEPKDALLSISGPRISAKLYADGIDMCDPLVSPLYARYSNNYNLMLSASDNDILTPDIDDLCQKLTNEGVNFKYEFYKDSYHDFILFNTPETEHLIKKVIEFLQ